MTSLSGYVEGILQVPISLIAADGCAGCPIEFSDLNSAITGFQQFLSNPNQPIIGILTPQMLSELLELAGISHSRLRQSLVGEALSLNAAFSIPCLIGHDCLERARQSVGNEFRCVVKVHCIPTELPGKYSDGEICRQVLLCADTPTVADSWLRKLPPGKQAHLGMLLRRPEVWAAMKVVAPFAGLWEDIQLGNVAKHLAAHCDELIVNYWVHLGHSWCRIFEGLTDHASLLDHNTVRFLQGMTPSWSRGDRKLIVQSLTSNDIFGHIPGNDMRVKLEQNISSIKGVIPSIQLFHENMRYLTIGAKIIEKHLVVRRKQDRAKSVVPYPRTKSESLFESFQRDWKQHSPQVESFGKYIEMKQPQTAWTAFCQVFLIALRHFPSLSDETPLQDIKGQGLSPKAGLDSTALQYLLVSAVFLGLRSTKTKELKLGSVTRLATQCGDSISAWRGGKPTIGTFHQLQRIAFIPSLSPATHAEGPMLSNILYDLFQVFFKLEDWGCIHLPAQPPGLIAQPAPPSPLNQTDVDMIEAPNKTLSPKPGNRPTTNRNRRPKDTRVKVTETGNVKLTAPHASTLQTRTSQASSAIPKKRPVDSGRVTKTRDLIGRDRPIGDRRPGGETYNLEDGAQGDLEMTDEFQVPSLNLQRAQPPDPTIEEIL